MYRQGSPAGRNLLHALLVSFDHLLAHVTRANFIAKSRCGTRVLLFAVRYTSHLTRTNFEPLQVLFRGFTGENLHIQPNATVFLDGDEDLVNVLIYKASGDDTGFGALLSFTQGGADSVHMLLELLAGKELFFQFLQFFLRFFDLNITLIGHLDKVSIGDPSGNIVLQQLGFLLLS